MGKIFGDLCVWSCVCECESHFSCVRSLWCLIGDGTRTLTMYRSKETSHEEGAENYLGYVRMRVCDVKMRVLEVLSMRVCDVWTCYKQLEPGDL